MISKTRLSMLQFFRSFSYRAITTRGPWRGTSRQKLYDELGWDSLYHRRWYRRMTHFYKLRSTRSPLYLYNLIPPERDLNYNLKMPYDYDQHIERTTRFSHTYFQNCVSGIAWMCQCVQVKQFLSLNGSF